MTKSYKEVNEHCAKMLYSKTLGVETGIAWAIAGAPIKDGYRRMIAVVFDTLWEFMTPDEICEFFRD